METTGTPPVLEVTLGKGNSPPARKLACLPFSASTFGSARIWRRPFTSSAWIVAPRFKSERKKKRLRAPESEATTGEVASDGTPGGENCCVDNDPIVLAAPVLTIFKPS